MCSVDWTQLEGAVAECPGVVAAWVFGSAQDGRVRLGGDLDVGVLFSVRPGLGERAELRARLQKATGIDAIDLIVLNDAPPLLRFEAVSGQSVFCRDRTRRADFVSLSARECEDEMAVLRRGMLYWDERQGQERMQTGDAAADT